ncbi:MAG: 2-oxoacid:acceptor oxidoreductase subunit alpha [Candidatus Omnitrophota bacterium]
MGAYLKDDISIVLGGEAGLGIQTIEQVLTKVLKLDGYNVFAAKEYMSRIRGGSNSIEIRVSSKKVSAYVNRIDILIPLDKTAIARLKKRISPKTIVLGDKEVLATELDVLDIPFSRIAKEVGNVIYANTVAAGAISGFFQIEPGTLEGFLKDYFSGKDEETVRNNIEASRKGYEIGLDLSRKGKVTVDVKKDVNVKKELFFNGAEAVGMGVIAGGCDFLSSYPMSPATSVMVFLAGRSKEFGIVVEQAEDEISAINMCLGAWYAGGRAIASTSGGGFDLMTEGLSLAGIIESPIVIHIGQRPGPATGLPTRTEQGDLELALYAGHGEYPRIILAPGTLEEAFYLTGKAFDLADKYQAPVIILTDQFLMDMYYNFSSLDLPKAPHKKHIVKTGRDYKRYKLTKDGISPRGMPGYGDGLVSLDSDEHDEEGHITEDFELRVKMVDKRLKKLESIKKDIVPPALGGDKRFKTLAVCWGTTYNVVKEAVEKLGRDDVAFLHFSQVYPLHPETLGHLEKAEKTVIIENNATSQLGKLIKLYFGFEIKEKILKYNGLPFSVEEIVKGLKEIAG